MTNAPPFPFLLHKLGRREGGIVMYGYNPYMGGCGVGGVGQRPSPGYGPSRRNCGQYGGSTFVLIVVLFILLIIVGSTFTK